MIDKIWQYVQEIHDAVVEEPEEPEEPETYDVKVSAVDENGDYIENITVDAIPNEEHESVQKRFGEGGWDTQEGYENVVYEGNYEITVEVYGYVTESKDVTIDDDTDVNFTLEYETPDTHDISVNIKDKFGNEPEDFEIVALPAREHPDVPKTFGNGGWKSEGKYENVVYEGDYEITVSADEYKDSTKTVSITDDTTAEIVLEFEEPQPEYAKRDVTHIDITQGDMNFMRGGTYIDGSPDEAHLRYEVYFPSDFEYHYAGNPGGSKLPGLLNTSTGGATGGDDPDGVSWSARPSTIRPNHPWCRDYAEGSEMKMLSQVYHLDQYGGDDYGEHIIWDEGWDKGEWVTIDQYVKLNTPDESDGVLRCWVNGELALDRTDLKYRDTSESDIERIWRGAYFGGTWGSPKDQYLEIGDMTLWTDDLPEV